MKQQTFSDIEYSNRKRKTKREEYLEIMDEIIQQRDLVRGEWLLQKRNGIKHLNIVDALYNGSL
jgi:hypothetical protein